MTLHRPRRCTRITSLPRRGRSHPSPRSQKRTLSLNTPDFGTRGAPAGPRLTPFAYGFRPFFFAALIYAPIAVLVWLWMLDSGRAPLPGLPPQLWHGHEMVFGFVGAAIAGFLLTAVPSWTGARGFAGAPLVAVVTAWLLGRLAFAFAAQVPYALLAITELAFLPVLIAMLAPPLLRVRNRNTPLLLVLVVLWACDTLFVHALARADATLASTALRASINVVLLLITVIGGRIVPAFTGNALRAAGVVAPIRTRGWLEVSVITAMVLNVVADAVALAPVTIATIAGIAALAHFIRLAGWQGWRTLGEPIVWVLHLAYAFLPLGLALKAVSLATGAAWAGFWLHSLTAGTIGLMIVAVITRASLGHTGRPLRVSTWISGAYLLLAGAAIVRVFGPALLMPHYSWTLCISGSLWIAGFAILAVGYAPILLQPRVDGKAG
ncbi:MAG: NnrS family protein [Pseudomonadota bacterium]